MNVPCKICSKRRARRHCLGLQADICPMCCGTAREETVDCPSECVHLQEARLHERPAAVAEHDLPNRDIQVSEKFVREHEDLVMALSMTLVEAMSEQKAVDYDAREALGSLIRTYRTLQSGLIYETRPANPFAAGIQEALKNAIDEIGAKLQEDAGMHTLRDAEVLGALVFLERMELQHNNGRRRGRAFFDILRSYFPAEPQTSVTL